MRFSVTLSLLSSSWSQAINFSQYQIKTVQKFSKFKINLQKSIPLCYYPLNSTGQDSKSKKFIYNFFTRKRLDFVPKSKESFLLPLISSTVYRAHFRGHKIAKGSKARERKNSILFYGGQWK